MSTPIVALSDAVCAATGLTPQDVGVSIGRWDDRSTWRVNFLGKPTDDQRKAADGALVAFDPNGVVDSPPRDLVAEIDALTAKVDTLTAKAQP